MRMALELAELGRGFVSPNPMVGAVIVKGKRVVGVGYHRRYGEEHAEVRAIRDAGDSARGATMYVTLEPHNFHGHQPPCTEAILEAGIARVVVGALDPNPKVRGGGVRRLREAGVEVVVGVLEEEVRRQNEIFFTFHERGRPFVALKLALTADGRIADRWGRSRWITSEAARERVHLMRSYHDAILVGAGTVRADDPLLTVRHVFTERQPLRVVLSRSGKLPCDARVFGGDAPTLLLSVREPECRPEGVEIIPFSGAFAEALEILRERGITSVLVEGGREVATTLLTEGPLDRIHLFIAPKFLGGDFGPLAKALPVGEALKFSVESAEVVGEDVLMELVADG
ncbi:MAG: bifunctional diaminohydroxyphosphoribosylaminopyrimidine deaminase/5-amino-6-(5-phosphoribosylamino)uracil reductase RibD [Thermotogae bacterium]|nr:bifunctional diaminohydroxyphosphoribosylaminopyrimidine deaminase/5-amino-6-(5-phosphoribosylamino)uracil reductase RibD [Thermotogota bacterium]